MQRLLAPLALAACGLWALPAGARAHHPAPAKKKAVDPTPAPTAIPDMPDRYIEKKVGAYDVALTLRPGNLKLRRVADVTVDLEKVLDIPDPVTGDRKPLVQGEPYAVVQGPEVEDRRHHRETPPPQKFRLYPEEERGRFGFHFTPTTDGLYTVTITGFDKNEDSGRLDSFAVPFSIGAGSFALQTEVSQGAAAVHHEARHPVGSAVRKPKVDKLRAQMEEIGQRTLDLGDLLRKPTRGPNVEAAAEARAIESLVTATKGMVPDDDSSEGAEYDRLAGETAQAFEELAKAAEAKRPPRGHTALAQYEALAPTHCDECHAKYRWGVTSDLSEWPKFAPRKWTKAGDDR